MCEQCRLAAYRHSGLPPTTKSPRLCLSTFFVLCSGWAFSVLLTSGSDNRVSVDVLLAFVKACGAYVPIRTNVLNLAVQLVDCFS